jgi:hypothetical protein
MQGAGVSAGKVRGAARIVLGCKRHTALQGAGVATGPLKFVVGALALGRLDWDWDWTWKTQREIRPFARTCGSVVVSPVAPSVVGRDLSPVFCNKARGYCCRTTGDHRAPLQPGRAARRHLRARDTPRVGAWRAVVGVAPGPRALPVPATPPPNG